MEMGYQFSGIIWVVLGAIIISLISIASNVMLGMCVYYDAMYRRNENALMWGVLSGFINICALIYIIMQFVNKKQPMRCVRCGEFLIPQSRFCTRCGRQLFVLSPELERLYDKRRRLFLGLWIGSTIFVIIISTIFAVIFMSRLIASQPSIYW